MNTETIPTDKSREPITPDTIWSEIEPSVVSNFQHETTSRDIEQEEIDRVMPGEEQFVRSVATTVLAALEAEPDAEEYLILFDIDESIARRSLRNREHMIRPAAAPLMAALKQLDPRVSIGLLTTRSQEYLDMEMNRPRELASVAPYLDPTKVLSSHSVNRKPSNTQGAIIDVDRGLIESNSTKLSECERLLQESPDKSIILVDDALDMDRDNLQNGRHLWLVSLDKTSAFWLHF